MSTVARRPGPPDDSGEVAADYRHLPRSISREDTVASVKGDVPADAHGEQNAFIAAAIQAGG